MKRAEITTDETVGIIVMAAATVVLIAWYVSFHGSINDTKDIEACRTSVQAFAASMGDTPGADFHLFDVDCQRRVITFTKNEVELNGKQHRYYDINDKKTKKSYGALNGDIVNSVVASEMSTCWYEFLEGKVRWTNEIDYKNDDTACYVCSEIRFEEDYGVIAAPFFDFLKATQSRPYPRPLREERPSYFDYLYMQPRVCDHEVSNLPSWLIGTWYIGDRSCEREFFDFITYDWADVTAEIGYDAESIAREWFLYDGAPLPGPLMDEKITISSDTSYLIMFYQYGQDWGETEAGQPTGTTYAPLIMKSSDLRSSTCNTFLG